MGHNEQQVLFIAPIYNYYPAIIPSLIMQKHQNWKLYLVHDGPNDRSIIDIKKVVDGFNDTRIHFAQTLNRKQKFGHPIRQQVLNDIQEGLIYQQCTHINITNADNYYTPNFCSAMLAGFRNPRVVATYCSYIIHSYTNWNPMQVMLKLGAIDTAGVLVKKECACEVGWNSMEHSSDWTYIEGIINKYDRSAIQKIPGALVVHN